MIMICKHHQQDIFLVLLFKAIGRRNELSGDRTGVRKQTESVLGWGIFWRQVTGEETRDQIGLNTEGGMLDQAGRTWDDSAPGVKAHETGYGGGQG